LVFQGSFPYFVTTTLPVALNLSASTLKRYAPAGRRDEALSVYEEFRNRLWRVHRKKPDFQLP
jgi:hypothetical protein